MSKVSAYRFDVYKTTYSIKSNVFLMSNFLLFPVSDSHELTSLLGAPIDLQSCCQRLVNCNTNVFKMTSKIVTTDNAVSHIDFGNISSSTTAWSEESNHTSTVVAFEKFSTPQSINNDEMVDKQKFQNESQDTSPVFEAFIIIEIVMTALELILTILATCKLKLWRKNYRNQMLMQLSLIRFLKRIFILIEFLKDKGTIPDSLQLSTLVISAQIYTDFVNVILIVFFIKHMYDSLIVVLVKISQNNLVKVLTCAWLLPLPISIVCTAITATKVLDYWMMYLLMCAIFRWPLMFIGTLLYITILFRVLNDKIRKFARILTIITFLLCLVMNLYLFCKDVIWLWCIHTFSTILLSYLLGFAMNFLVLCLYLTLITLSFRCDKNKKCYTLRPNFSKAAIRYY